jgi:hypothetical protein
MIIFDAVHNGFYLAVNVSSSHDNGCVGNDKRLSL